MAADHIPIGKLAIEGRAPKRWLWVLYALGLVVLVAIAVEIVARHDRAEQAARDAYWRVDGPPCAPLEPMLFKSLRRLPQATPYDEALYRRLGGTMSCTHLVDGAGKAKVRYPVCRFSGPDYLVVSQGGQDRFYDLTGAKSASVTVRDGEVRCIVTRRP